MRLILAAFTLAALALNGQGWSDAQDGNGQIPRETQGAITLIFPDCPTEDSDWCYWDGGDNGEGWQFISINDHVITFK